MNENRAAAERWLAKAVTMEAEGKPTSLVNKALDKALEYEQKANGTYVEPLKMAA